ncbi:Insertion element IS630 uncharacterized 39 kDa protein [Cucumispora dikerogammari]|nr:Insertion element IS630 uncharacterized 39 kDa protein [Cucumispora dikerogammari]
MRLSYGRSLVGTPAKKVVRSIRSKNYSICAAISKGGIIHYISQKQSFNGDSFINFLSELFRKMTKRRMFGFTFIIDNVVFHKAIRVKEPIEENEHIILFLPPYSLQLNSIDNFFLNENITSSQRIQTQLTN